MMLRDENSAAMVSKNEKKKQDMATCLYIQTLYIHVILIDM